MTQTMREAGLKAYDLFAVRLEMLQQHLRLCESRAKDQSGMNANEQLVTFAHLLNQLEELTQMYDEAIESATVEGTRS